MSSGVPPLKKKTKLSATLIKGDECYENKNAMLIIEKEQLRIRIMQLKVKYEKKKVEFIRSVKCKLNGKHLLLIEIKAGLEHFFFFMKNEVTLNYDIVMRALKECCMQFYTDLTPEIDSLLKKYKESGSGSSLLHQVSGLKTTSDIIRKKNSILKERKKRRITISSDDDEKEIVYRKGNTSYSSAKKKTSDMNEEKKTDTVRKIYTEKKTKKLNAKEHKTIFSSPTKEKITKEQPKTQSKPQLSYTPKKRESKEHFTPLFEKKTQPNNPIRKEKTNEYLEPVFPNYNLDTNQSEIFPDKNDVETDETKSEMTLETDEFSEHKSEMRKDMFSTLSKRHSTIEITDDTLVDDKDEYIYYEGVNDKKCIIEDKFVDILKNNEMINDGIIAFYLCYLEKLHHKEIEEQKILLMNTFFMKKLDSFFLSLNSNTSALDVSKTNWKRITSWYKNNLFNYNYVLIPYYQSSHFSLIILCLNEQLSHQLSSKSKNVLSESPCILYFDSLFDTFMERKIKTELLLLIEAEYYAFKHESKHIKELNNIIPEYKYNDVQQRNGVDCGCYVLYFIQKFIVSEKNSLQQMSKEFNENEAYGQRRLVTRILKEELEKCLFIIIKC